MSSWGQIPSTIIFYHPGNSKPSIKNVTSELSWRNVHFSRRKQTTSDSTLEMDDGDRRMRR